MGQPRPWVIGHTYRLYERDPGSFKANFLACSPKLAVETWGPRRLCWLREALLTATVAPHFAQTEGPTMRSHMKSVRQQG